MSEHRRKVVVVGGGITGLTAAYTLQRKSEQSNTELDIVLIEASHRVGGKIETIRNDGYVMERGPESFFDPENTMRELARNLQIEQKIIQHNDGKTYIAVGTELHKIPSSFLLGGSREVTGLITSSLISLVGKARASADLVIGQSVDRFDESIGDFFRRRFGKEVVENLVEPLLAGTFAGDIDHLSMEAMFPQFTQLEKEERSLIKGFLKNRQGFYNANPNSKELHYETFENGLTTLIEALESTLKPGVIRKGQKVDFIERTMHNTMNIYLHNASVIEADAVIITTPFNNARSILRDIPTIERMEPMKAATIATVSMAFNKGDIEKYKEALNIFVSRNSHFAITSCTFANRKWNQVCPDSCELLRIYIGRVGDESIVELSDYEITQTVLSDLEKMLGIKNPPLFSYVTRWQQGMPQYTVGHNLRTRLIKDELSKVFPNVVICGSSYEGVSMPNCVKQGKEAAEAIYSKLIN